ncbi:hypothetical protein E2562_027185 [Oryza meyeriana var. granulata]|uniref:Uncharacterized protein n=1 Tax=Oryza meyeriana var. granulata TaxID=110450 RepID=A0A6G1EZC6_9ORYZ|nr:hypothetical protein E2562_027185 [Oryza meyeriana var. granulata]
MVEFGNWKAAATIVVTKHGEERARAAIGAGEGAAERLPVAANLLAVAARPNEATNTGGERLEARPAVALGAHGEGELGGAESLAR